MLSKAQISLITSLQHKKFRTQHNLFVVEGIKSVLEFAHSTYKISKIFATADAAVKLGKIPQNIKLEELTVVEFGKISRLGVFLYGEVTKKSIFFLLLVSYIEDKKLLHIT